MDDDDWENIEDADLGIENISRDDLEKAIRLLDMNECKTEEERLLDENLYDEMADLCSHHLLRKCLEKNGPNCSQGHTQFEVGRFVYIVGGYSDSENDLSNDQDYNSLRNVWRYDKYTSEWWLCCTFGPQSILTRGLCGSAGVAHSKYLYLFFGFERHHNDTDEVLRLNLEDYHWQRCVSERSPRPLPRNKHGCFRYQDELIIFGGFGPREVNQFNHSSQMNIEEAHHYHNDYRSWNNDLFYYDVHTQTFQNIVDVGKRPAPRAAFGYTQLNEVGFIFGGRCAFGRQNDLHRFDLRTKTWSEIITCCPKPEPRSWLSLVNQDDTLIVFGGLNANDSALDDNWRLDLKTEKWDKVENVFPTAYQHFEPTHIGRQRSHSDPTVTRHKRRAYCRMWHTAFINEVNGKMEIIGGTNSQTLHEDIPPHFSLQVRVPELFSIASQVISTSLPDSATRKLNRYIMRRTRYELRCDLMENEFKILNKLYRQKLRLMNEPPFVGWWSRLPERYKNNKVLWTREDFQLETKKDIHIDTCADEPHAFMEREDFLSLYTMGRQLTVRGANTSTIGRLFFPNQDHFLTVMMHKFRAAIEFNFGVE